MAWLGLGGLAEVGFLVLPEIVHVEIAVFLEPALMGLDRQSPDKTKAALLIGEYPGPLGSGA